MSGVSESELGKRGSGIAQRTAEKVVGQAEELRRTDVGQAVQKVWLIVFHSPFNYHPSHPHTLTPSHPPH